MNRKLSFIEAMYIKSRMCNTMQNCSACILNGEKCDEISLKNPKKAEKLLIKWTRMNPPKSRQTELLKILPDTPLDGDGVVDLLPCTFM